MPDVQVQELQRKVNHVRRRQLVQGLLGRLPVSLAVALVLATVWWVVQPYLRLELAWWVPLAVLAPLAAVLAAGITYLRRPRSVESALALDEAFNLRERVTTAISLTEEQKRSPAGVALLEDVQGHIARLDVAARFPLRLPRSAGFVPLAGLVFALAVLFYEPISPSAGGTGANGGQAGQPEQAVPRIETREVKERNEQRRQRAADSKLEKLDDLLADLDQITHTLDNAKKDVDIENAIQQLTRLGEEMQQRKDELNKTREAQKQLAADEKLRDVRDGPAKDFQEALAEGDLQAAQKAVEQLAEDLKTGNLTEEQRRLLEQQLGDVQQRLRDIANQTERREKLANSDLDPETKRQEEEKINQDCQNLQELNSLANQLAQAQQALKEGKPGAAQQKLQEAQAQLQQMEQQQRELAELDEAMQDVQNLKQCLG
jgi:chemotaxis protein histidine kinase CheA